MNSGDGKGPLERLQALERDGQPVAFSVERAAKNQGLFREVNERIARLSEPLAVADVRLFVCECSHEDCAEALELTLGEFDEVRANGACFVIAPGHEIDALERVVARNGRFAVIEKVADTRSAAAGQDPGR